MNQGPVLADQRRLHGFGLLADREPRVVGRGRFHPVAAQLDGTFWGWGSNYSGELGQSVSGFKMYDTPIQVTAGSDWADVAWGGDYRGQLGNGDYVSLYEPPLATGVMTWQTISSGSNSFALMSDGMLWAWGDNAWGQLGLGDPTACRRSPARSASRASSCGTPTSTPPASSSLPVWPLAAVCCASAFVCTARPTRSSVSSPPSLH